MWKIHKKLAFHHPDIHGPLPFFRSDRPALQKSEQQSIEVCGCGAGFSSHVGAPFPRAGESSGEWSKVCVYS